MAVAPYRLSDSCIAITDRGGRCGSPNNVTVYRGAVYGARVAYCGLPGHEQSARQQTPEWPLGAGDREVPGLFTPTVTFLAVGPLADGWSRLPDDSGLTTASRELIQSLERDADDCDLDDEQRQSVGPVERAIADVQVRMLRSVVATLRRRLPLVEAEARSTTVAVLPSGWDDGSERTV